MARAKSEEEFLDSLTELLLAEGIEGLTVGEIASRVHCSRRRLYELAQTKEEIFLAVVQHFFNGLLAEGDAIGAERDQTAAIAAYLAVGVRAAHRMSARFLKEVETSAPASAIFDRYQQRRTLGLSELVDDGVRKGVFVSCHGLVVSELILGAALRLRRPAFLANANLTLEEAFQEFYRVLLNGLLTSSNSAKRGGQVGHRVARTRHLPK
jgi:AcrR family transcriptional regulator